MCTYTHTHTLVRPHTPTFIIMTCIHLTAAGRVEHFENGTECNISAPPAAWDGWGCPDCVMFIITAIMSFCRGNYSLALAGYWSTRMARFHCCRSHSTQITATYWHKLDTTAG